MSGGVSCIFEEVCRVSGPVKLKVNFCPNEHMAYQNSFIFNDLFWRTYSIQRTTHVHAFRYLYIIFTCISFHLSRKYRQNKHLNLKIKYFNLTKLMATPSRTNQMITWLCTEHYYYYQFKLIWFFIFCIINVRCVL